MKYIDAEPSLPDMTSKVPVPTEESITIVDEILFINHVSKKIIQVTTTCSILHLTCSNEELIVANHLIANSLLINGTTFRVVATCILTIQYLGWHDRIVYLKVRQ